MSIVKGVEFVSSRVLCITRRGRWYDIVLNVDAPTKGKIHDMIDSIYEDLEHVFSKFPKYRMEILLGNFICQSRWGKHFQPNNWE
jgi:hypothetical protein